MMTIGLWVAIVSTMLPIVGSDPSLNLAAFPAPVLGPWRVVKHYAPEGVEPDKAAIKKWMGKTAIYAPTGIKFDAEQCKKPSFKVDTVDAVTFLQDGLHIAPRRLGINDKNIKVITVSCAGKEWISPGSLLVLKDNQHLLTFWDGVFFELAR